MHLHIESAAAPLSLSAGHLRAAILARGTLADADLVITENADPDLFPAAASGADVIFACRKIDIAAARGAAPGLRWVQVISAGVEALLPSLPADVLLTNASGVHAAKGAEFVLTAALMLNYAIPAFVDDKAAGLWQPRFGGPIAGRRALLLGAGGIGAAAARALAERGVTVDTITRTGRGPAEVATCHGLDALDGLLPQTDYLISTLPLTGETRGLIDARRLALLPERAGVIVVGRAAVFDYAALEALLRAGRLGGAVLDVFPHEPLPVGDTLWSCPRLIVTPHCSVDDHDSYMAGCLAIFLDNLERLRDGRPLNNLVDVRHGY